MQLVDSHCHLDMLDLAPYDGDLNKALAKAKEYQVTHFLCVSVTLTHFKSMVELIKPYPFVDASLGLHPNEPVEKEPTVDELVQLGQDKKIVALGETGLDYYRSEGDLTWQKERFRCHIRAAKQLKKPLIIHSRQARADTLAILREEEAETVGGVMHCFTEDWEMAKAALDLNFYISFSGIVTFKNATDIQAVAKQVPLDRVLIETDSPYLAPNPHRGKPNEPAYVRYVAEFIATLREMSFEEVALKTTQNYFNLFGRQAHV